MSNLHEKCEPCTRKNGEDCAVYTNPSYWWDKRTRCPMATFTHKLVETTTDKKVNPLKASRRRAKGR